LPWASSVALNTNPRAVIGERTLVCFLAATLIHPRNQLF
jgi:hypothetical protein